MRGEIDLDFKLTAEELANFPITLPLEEGVGIREARRIGDTMYSFGLNSEIQKQKNRLALVLTPRKHMRQP